MVKLKLQYWLDGGVLIGINRYHGKHMMPWDLDADVGMTDSEYSKLNSILNSKDRKVPCHISPGELGLPPNMIVVGCRDKYIPARMIETESGLYIDVFGTFSKQGDYYKKSWRNHPTFKASDIFPIVSCELKGVGHIPCPHNQGTYSWHQTPLWQFPDHHWNPMKHEYQKR